MRRIFSTLVLAFLLAGCDREKVQTYQTPKEDSSDGGQTEQPAGKGFEATLPPGWKELPASGIRTASYTIEGTDIDFYLVPLRVGDVPSNVNRWRGQLGLPPETPEAIMKSVETFQVDGHETHFVKIFNPANNRGIVVAIVDLSPEFWYFTAKGPTAELQAHLDEMRAFLDSLKIDGERQ